MTVHTPVEVALFNELPKQFHVRPLAGTNDRSPYGDAVRFHLPKDVVNDFLYGSPGDLFTACWAVRFTDSRPEKTKVILNFSHGCNG